MGIHGFIPPPMKMGGPKSLKKPISWGDLRFWEKKWGDLLFWGDLRFCLQFWGDPTSFVYLFTKKQNNPNYNYIICIMVNYSVNFILRSFSANEDSKISKFSSTMVNYKVLILRSFSANVDSRISKFSSTMVNYKVLILWSFSANVGS